MNEYITNKQLAFIIFGALIGYGVMTSPKQVAENAGTGGWISILLATVVAVLLTYVITYLGYHHKNKTLYEYSKILTGKYISTVIKAIYIIYFFVVFSMLTRISSEVIKLTLLIKTPVWVFTFLFLLTAYFGLLKGIRPIARLCEIYGIIVILVASLVHLIIFTQGEILNLKPFFVIEDLNAYIKTTMVTIVPFLGIEILMLIPFHEKENNKTVFSYTLGATGLIGIFYILIVESCISIMGVEEIIFYEDALFATIRRVDVEFLQLFRRLDAFFIIPWIMTLVCTIILFAYGTVSLMSKCCVKVPYRLLLLLVLIAGFITAQIPNTIEQIQQILNIIGYAGLITAGFIPLSLFILTKVRKGEKR